MTLTHIILGCVIALAICALFFHRKRRPLAINAVADMPPTPPAIIDVGIPSGLSQTAIAARATALVNIGTPRFLAEKFAIDAERQQAWHDNPKKREGTQASAKTEAEKIAANILEAQKVDPTKAAKPLTDKQLEDRAAAVEKMEADTKALAGEVANQKSEAERLLAEATDKLAQANAALEQANNKKGAK